MTMKLKELIRAVRACKTAAAERTVVSQELAVIRTAFKEEQLEYRNRNVAKLLFMHMLGYPSHFGQMECIKLITSPEFTDKRIGYLGLMLLLTEKEEVLMLVTNSLKVDLNAQNPFVVGLALTTVGNLATTDIARDLMMDVDKHLQSSNPYLRKKAALCTIRILQKNPDHVEDFSERIVGVLKDRHHGVLLSGVQLMTSVIALDPKAYACLFVRVIPSLVRLLKNLVSVGYSPDHDVSGITNPFLQVKTLRLLRLLGEHGGSDDAAEIMNDILAQVASTTETAKNAGNAILYECVSTITAVQSEQSLQVLAVNILGRFLLNRDNNIRYVALNTLGKVVEQDSMAVQRHRTTIVDCLKDPDVSIRQRSLELIYKLVNEYNVTVLANEMLNYLVIALPEHKPSLCDKILDAVERFSSDNLWRVETLISLLGIAGEAASNAVSSTTIIYIGQSPEHQGYIVHKLYASLVADLPTQLQSQPGLMKVGIWCIGEYGELLTKPNPGPNGGNPVSLGTVLALFSNIMSHHSANSITRSYCITALAKLCGRGFFTPEETTRVGSLISQFGTSLHVDLQQRSCELSQLFSSTWSSVRSATLEKMPAIDEATLKERKAKQLLKNGTAGAKADGDFFDRGDIPPTQTSRVQPTTSPKVSNPPNPPNLLDLDDIFGGSAATTLPQATVQSDKVDLLADIFSSLPSTTTTNLPTFVKTENLLGDTFSDIEPMPAVIEPVQPSLVAFEKGPLRIVFLLSKPDSAIPASTQILARFSNIGGVPLDNLVFQAAVPKYLTMRLLPASSGRLNVGGPDAEQVILITNEAHGAKEIMLRIKVTYIQDGQQVQEMSQISNFPSGY